MKLNNNNILFATANFSKISQIKMLSPKSGALPDAGKARFTLPEEQQSFKRL